jgi:sugar O-acyltransferase (sialic acid O-acetyltransferase NeuD family)
MKKALIGYGGHAKEVISQIGEELTCFVDDIFIKDNNPKILPISQFNINEFEVLVAIGDSEIRKKIVDKLPKETQYFTFIHPSAQIFDKNISIGEGSFIGANCILTTNISIGAHCILNRGNHIGHDTIIGKFFSAMPNVVVSGNCNIGDYVYIGTNSTAKEKIKICDNVIIGLNSGVIKDITESGTYIGTPTKKIK